MLRNGSHPTPIGCVLAVQMLSNLLLMRGNIGRPAPAFSLSAVTPMSKVKGVGITEKPELAPLDQLANQYSFEPPRMKGLDPSKPAGASLMKR